MKGTDTHYCHFDELGSTRLLTDGSGTVTDRYAYDAYGSLISHDRYQGSIDQPYQYVGQLGYYTHHQEPEFGLLQLGVRFYDAEVGRFTSRDAVPGIVGLYAYANNNPASAVDPTGLLPNVVLDKSCEERLGEKMARWVEKRVLSLLSELDSQQSCFFSTDRSTYSISCVDCLPGSKNWGGVTTGMKSATIAVNPGMPSAECLVLHEMLHFCKGKAGGHCWNATWIPGCGDVSYNHSRGVPPPPLPKPRPKR